MQPPPPLPRPPLLQSTFFFFLQSQETSFDTTTLFSPPPSPYAICPFRPLSQISFICLLAPDTFCGWRRDSISPPTRRSLGNRRQEKRFMERGKKAKKIGGRGGKIFVLRLLYPLNAAPIYFLFSRAGWPKKISLQTTTTPHPHAPPPPPARAGVPGTPLVLFFFFSLLCRSSEAEKKRKKKQRTNSRLSTRLVVSPAPPRPVGLEGGEMRRVCHLYITALCCLSCSPTHIQVKIPPPPF